MKRVNNKVKEITQEYLNDLKWRDYIEGLKDKEEIRIANRYGLDVWTPYHKGGKPNISYKRYRGFFRNRHEKSQKMARNDRKTQIGGDMVSYPGGWPALCIAKGSKCSRVGQFISWRRPWSVAMASALNPVKTSFCGNRCAV
jgi:hypothetical protein